MRQDFFEIFDKETVPLLAFFRNKLTDAGYQGNMKLTTRQLLQETMETAYETAQKKNLMGYQETRSLVRLVAKNKLYKFFNPPKKFAATDDIDTVPAPTDSAPDPCERLEIQERLEPLKGLVNEEMWEIFHRVAEGATYKELAEEFNTTEAAIKERIYRARKEIKIWRKLNRAN